MASLLNLKTLDLRGNGFLCDCNMAWFRSFVDQTVIQLVGLENYTCGYPHDWENRLFLEFQPRVLQCLTWWEWLIFGLIPGR